MNVGDGTRFQRLVDIVRNLRRQKIVRVLREHARDIQGHIPVPDDRDLFRVQRPIARNVGVTVIPRHEIGCTVGTVEVDPGNVEVGVPNRSRRENHGVIVPFEIVQGDVGAKVDVPKDANPARVEHVPQRVDNPLDAGVVGSNTVSDESVGSREAVKQVNRHVERPLVFLQDVGGIDSGGASAHDRESKLHVVPNLFGQ